jgi:hypothetical protein
VVAVATAVVIAGLGSRVNRPDAGGIPSEPRGRRVADELLADVRLDGQSLRTVVESINAAAGRRRVRLDVPAVTADYMDRTDHIPGPQRLRNVRLGRALALGAARWLHPDELACREAEGEIVIGPAKLRPVPVTARVYDVAELVDEADAWSNRLPGGAAPSARSGRAADVAAIVRVEVNRSSWGQPGWRIEGAGAWLYVSADAQGHRKVGQFLALLRQGDSGPAAPAGGAR